MNVKKAVIPIAGKGTRFLPATKSIPKEMIPILSKPMIDHVIDEVLASGIDEVIFITAVGKEATKNFYEPAEQLEDFLKNAGKESELELVKNLGKKIKVSCVNQEEQLGLGHAISMAKDLVGGDEYFAILLPDDLTINEMTPVTSQLISICEKYKSSVIGVMEVEREKVHKYGVISYTQELEEKTFLMSGMTEKPKAHEAPSFLATPGRYILSSEIFNFLEKIPRGAGGEYQLTDAISMMAKSETHQVCAHQFDGKRYDTGSLEGYFEATLDFARKDKDLNKFFLDYISKI